MPIDRARVGAEYHAPEFVVTAERIEAYADATREPSPAFRGEDAVAPPAFAVVPAWPALVAAMSDESAGIEVGRTLHGEQRMRLHRPIRPGDVLRTVARLASVEDKGANEVFVLALHTIDASGEAVADQEVVVVSRGTAATASSEAPAGSKPAREAPSQPPAPDLERTIDLDPEITFVYAAASGDENRIHVDEEFARSVGLPGTIVHGLCLLSIALQPIVELAGGPERIREIGVRFARPIQPGQPFTTRVWRSENGFTFDAAGPDGDVLRTGRVTEGPVTAPARSGP
jgi:acyl dehydratase